MIRARFLWTKRTCVYFGAQPDQNLHRIGEVGPRVIFFLFPKLLAFVGDYLIELDVNYYLEGLKRLKRSSKKYIDICKKIILKNKAKFDQETLASVLYSKLFRQLLFNLNDLMSWYHTN